MNDTVIKLERELLKLMKAKDKLKLDMIKNGCIIDGIEGKLLQRYELKIIEIESELHAQRLVK